jgi:hypothetical protein
MGHSSYMNPISMLFLVAFIAGLVLAVIAMLHGVEHTRPSRSRAPSPFFNLPALAALAVGFGAVGYPLSTRTRVPDWAILITAAASGAVAMTGMITLLARWALRGAENSAGEEIQGHLATVTRQIETSSPGEISYQLRGSQIKVPAKPLGARPIPAGSEVVIDRIENGIAFVEEWSMVEQRI